ncbi:putative HTH-type transcriptional regulator YdfH (plasmid) [Hartmannibacter diazotrophicus]|uniref:Putative HTH-type transcriptional regulator YdfH n=1 Tax=Hartmannibacter diazotrophicus TaxID=1482074 RepID=A0A2C9DDZ4_9HYPH|nr:GntR family transcriptional regulator [Hartmannibacter diazotrophicus]SON58496.1 putative HTH-type transcriptional regulator YdfH [Hartmannibacter diazotrophicus]
MRRPRSGPKLVDSDTKGASGPKRRNSMNLFELAYEQLEELIVNCQLAPGRFLAIQDLQAATGFSRTPVHQAVGRLAADTLIHVRPRHGLQIAPIDLARERMLLLLRRDLERFVIKLAAENASPAQRNQLLHLVRVLRERRDTLTIDEFNALDRRIDQLVLASASEPFLVHTLRPLHTIFRRIGWIHHNYTSAGVNLGGTIDCHLAVLDAVANRHVERAVAASDALIGFVEAIFDGIERDIDPSLLDCSIEPLFRS